MKLYADLHTHTINSSGKFRSRHATGTILENAMFAKQKGIMQIAITDHGFNHFFYSLQEKYIQRLKKEIEEAKQKTGVDILFGVEANLISRDGSIDLTQKQQEYFDFVVVGYHKTVKAKTFADFFKYILPNALGVKTKKMKQINTMALVSAMERNRINLISHVGASYVVDMEQVAKASIKTNTYLEINGRRILYTKSDIEMMNGLGVKFLINSDAHKSERIGKIAKAITFAVSNNVNLDNVINLNRALTKDDIKQF